MEQSNSKLKKAIKILSAIFLLVFLPMLVYASLQMIRYRQKASVEGGEFNVELSPASGTYRIDQSFPVAVKFDLGANPIYIAALAVRLIYNYSEDTPIFTVIDSDELANGTQVELGPEFKKEDWNCPVNKVTFGGGKALVDISCANTTITGYKTTEKVTLATVTFKATDTPANNPVELTFDAAESIITRKSDGQDFLAIPSSKGSYKIESSELLGDINGDSLVDDYDLSVLLGKWGATTDIISVDFNKDGLVDDADLSILLSHWTG